MMSTNLVSLLLEADPLLPDELVYFGDEVVGRSDLVAAARDVAAHLVGAGVRPGMTVGGLLPNHPDAIAAIFGVWAADAVYVPLNPRAPQAELEVVASSVGLAAVIGEAATLRNQAGTFGGALHMTLGDWRAGGAIPGDVRSYPPDL